MATDVEQIQLYARTRDAGAFAALMAAYTDMVFATCLRILANRSEAEDATQECFWRLARESAGIRTSVGAWLHRCATNECITRKRRKAAKAQRELAYERTRQAERDEASEWREVSPAVDEALEELPEELRTLLIGHFLQRRTQAELAAEMGVSPATMSRRLAEGVELIRKRLKARGVIATAALLTLFLAERTASAATPAVVAGLGKMALAGPPAHALRWTLRAKAVVAGAALAASAGIVWGAQAYFHRHAPPQALAAPVQKVEAQTSVTEPQAQTPPQAYRLLAQIRNGLPEVAGDGPLEAARSLVALGPKASPAVAAELDRSTRDDEQRVLIWTLRLIGDRAAVPALLRALPRLSTEAVPYEVAVTDPGLRLFVRDHQPPGLTGFAAPSVGLQPARLECVAALEALTGRAAVYTLDNGARRPVPDVWIAWYAQQTGATQSTLAAPPAAGDPVGDAGRLAFAALFPTGPQVRLSNVHEVLLDARNGWNAPAYLDLDTGRRLERNEGWTDHGQHPHADWPREAGVDIGIDSGGGAPLLQSFGMTVWPLQNVRFETLPAEVHLNAALDIGDAAPRVLREKLGQDPHTWLFATREGGRGALQVTLLQAPGGPTLRVRYRLFEGTRSAPPPLTGQIEAPATQTAGQFGPEREVELGSARPDASMAVDLDTGALRADAPDPDIGALTAAKTRWLREWGGDLVVLPAQAGEPSELAADRFIALPVTADAWDHLQPPDAAALLLRRDATVDPTEALLRLPAGEREAWVFQTREGCAGLMQIESDAPGTVRVRYKVLR
ncbi:MAG TPA: sigma-70 family RNA polymerase sigma factor [Phycisphaerae bacterium]|nr:sigma-70 family RNA polymerase sigma factor [Phycisphaerae bacterium]